jgi:ABC-type multidrug transport system fused ATPase/permease subunit
VKERALLRRTFELLRPDLWRERRAIAGVIVLLALGVPISAAPPLLLARLFDVALPAKDQEQTVLLLAAIVVLALCVSLISFFEQRLAITIWQRTRFHLSRRLARHVLGMSLQGRSELDAGLWLGRVRDDVDRLEKVMPDRGAMMVVHGVRAALYLGLLWYLDPAMAIAGMVLVFMVGLLIGSAGPRLRTIAATAQESNAQLNSSWLELLRGWSMIKVSGAEKSEVRQLTRKLKGSARAAVRRDLWATAVDNVLGVALQLGLYGLLALAAYRIFFGHSTLGALVGFFGLISLLVGSVQVVLGLWPAFQQGLASADRLIEVLTSPLEQPRIPAAARLPRRGRGRLEVCRLSFGYRPGEPVLKNLELAIEPGQKTALVGRSGAGKSTLVSLLLGFRRPDGGELRFDGRPYDDFSLEWLRRQIGWVPQDVVLWNRSIRANLLLGRPRATEEELIRAAHAAQALDFIAQLPQGFDTVIGEAGERLSGGQRQRLAIARELIRDPPFLIFDEATSQLDAEGEHLLQKATAKLLDGRSALIIAHRFSTIRHADRVLVLDRGRIVEAGCYEDLAANEGIFARLQGYQSVTADR